MVLPLTLVTAILDYTLVQLGSSLFYVWSLLFLDYRLVRLGSLPQNESLYLPLTLVTAIPGLQVSTVRQFLPLTLSTTILGL